MWDLTIIDVLQPWAIAGVLQRNMVSAAKMTRSQALPGCQAGPLVCRDDPCERMRGRERDTSRHPR